MLDRQQNQFNTALHTITGILRDNHRDTLNILEQQNQQYQHITARLNHLEIHNKPTPPLLSTQGTLMTTTTTRPSKTIMSNNPPTTDYHIGNSSNTISHDFTHDATRLRNHSRHRQQTTTTTTQRNIPPTNTPPITNTTCNKSNTRHTTTHIKRQTPLQSHIQSTPSTGSIDQAWGDSINQKDDNTTRMYFQNANGLPFRNAPNNLINKLSPLHDIQPDYVCLAEPNLDFIRPEVLFHTNQAFRRIFDQHTKTQTSCSSLSWNNSYKPGGTLITSIGHNSSRISHSNEDHHRLGRWSYILLRAKGHRTIVLASAYRLYPNGKSATPGPLTAYSQQRTILRETSSNPDPNRLRDRHFHEQIASWHALNYDMIIAMDANDSLHPASKIHLKRTSTPSN